MPGARRDFVVTGVCGIPRGAVSISVNATVVAPEGAGSLSFFPGGIPEPGTSAISFAAGRTRANNAIVLLAADGTFSVTNASGGAVPFILDVNGCFLPAPPSISYGGTSFAYTTGTAIAPLTPVNTGGAVVTWSTDVPFPSGLVFSTVSGSVTGTPNAIAPSTAVTVTATNAGGSSVVHLSVKVNPPPPSITTPPASRTVDIGASPSFSVAATGTGPLGYQWSKNGMPIDGATLASYTSSSVVYVDSGALFAVTVTDGYGGSVASPAAVLTVRPDLATWLEAHPNVRDAIKWQFVQADMVTYNSYAPPTDVDKVPWSAWTQAEKDELNQAYLDARAWFDQGAQQVAMPYGGLTDQPDNQNLYSYSPGVVDTITTSEWVTKAYMRKLYVAHVAFSLALEIAGPLPWGITAESGESLRLLFDSAVMAWYLPNGFYGMGTYMVPPSRADNRPHTAFAPPEWTYPFLRQAGLIGATRLETIGRVLDWMRHNLWHFYGNETFGNYYSVWQYRGWVPLSKIVNGTIDSKDAADGVQHWTAGCHGSVGFLHEVLRVLNIPVQPIWVCGHELAGFTTEGLYLDHGDDPYNAVTRSHPDSSILSLLIDETTYRSRFTSDPTLNVTDQYSPVCLNVGRSAAEFH